MSTTDLVVGFSTRAFDDGDPEGAAAEALGAACTQHNPEAQDGPEAFIGDTHRLRGELPDLRLEIERTVEQGDLVVTHSTLHLTPGDRFTAVADFWRVEDGRIVEHWDVVQEVPEKPANQNTMF